MPDAVIAGNRFENDFGVTHMSILSLISQFATPEVIGRLAGLSGTPQSAITKAVTGAVPSVLAALLGAVGSPQTANVFANVLGRQPANAFDGLGARLAQDAGGIASTGSDDLTSIIGSGRVGALASKLKDYAGLPEGTSGPLLGLVSSIAMGALGKVAGAGGAPAAIKALEGEKDNLVRALPKDFAQSLRGAGVLDSISDRLNLAATPHEPFRTKPVETRAVPEPKGTPWLRWLAMAGAGLLALALLSRLFGGHEEPKAVVVPETKPAVTHTTTTTAPTYDLTTLTTTVRDSLGELTTSLGTIADETTAKAALPTLTSVRDRLAGIQTSVDALPGEARSTLGGVINTALPALRAAYDNLLGNSAIATTIKPVMDAVFTQLTNYAK